MNKNMKYCVKGWIVIALLATALAVPAAMAQGAVDRVTVALTDPARPAVVAANLINGGITVKGGDTKEVIVEARVRHGDGGEGNKGGMRRIPVSSTGLVVEEENNVVRVGTDSTQRTVDLTITVPRLSTLRLRATNDGDITVSNVEGEMDVNNANGEVTLKDIAGSAVAHALNGEIKVNFIRVGAKPMAFSSLNGNIDVTFPADLRANIALKTDNGEVYSDFDVQIQPGSAKPIVEDTRGRGGKYRVKIDKTIRGTINGGGPEIQFTNFNGDIYIRKAGSPK